jgi:hypothetical protein
MNTTPGLDACVAAGWSEARIARMVLGERVGAIPVELVILTPQAMKRQCAEIDASAVADDEALVCADRLWIGAAVLRAASPAPWAGVRAALRNRHVARLRVLCTAADIQQHGLPVDRLHRVSIQDRLPEAWRKCLEQACVTSQSENDGDPISPDEIELIGQPFN